MAGAGQAHAQPQGLRLRQPGAVLTTTRWLFHAYFEITMLDAWLSVRTDCVKNRKHTPDQGDKFFYHSSVQLASKWYEAGNKGEAYFGAGLPYVCMWKHRDAL